MSNNLSASDLGEDLSFSSYCLCLDIRGNASSTSSSTSSSSSSSSSSCLETCLETPSGTLSKYAYKLVDICIYFSMKARIDWFRGFLEV
jgi:hypothetical protein